MTCSTAIVALAAVVRISTLRGGRSTVTLRRHTRTDWAGATWGCAQCGGGGDFPARADPGRAGLQVERTDGGARSGANAAASLAAFQRIRQARLRRGKDFRRSVCLINTLVGISRMPGVTTSMAPHALACSRSRESSAFGRRRRRFKPQSAIKPVSWNIPDRGTSMQQWDKPVVEPPALPRWLRAGLLPTDTRPPLQTVVCKHLVEL